MRSLVVAALILASCGGGATAPAASEPAAAATQGAAATAAPAGAATAAPAAAAEPAFADIIRSGKAATYKVAYKITVTGAGQGGDAATGMALYFKPPKTRIDLSGTQEGKTSAIAIYYLDTGTFFCTADGDQKSCLQTSTDPGEGQAAGFEIQESFREDPAGLNATFRENRTIAGQQALCYVVRGTVALGFSDGTFCYTSSGVPLLSTWSAEGVSWTMEATSYSATVPDNDFTLPAAPMKVPGAP